MTDLRPGALVRLVSPSDSNRQLRSGESGTVERIEQTGTLHVHWESGATVALIPGEDVWELVHPRWWDQPFGPLDPEEDDR